MNEDYKRDGITEKWIHELMGILKGLWLFASFFFASAGNPDNRKLGGLVFL